MIFVVDIFTVDNVSKLFIIESWKKNSVFFYIPFQKETYLNEITNYESIFSYISVDFR